MILHNLLNKHDMQQSNESNLRQQVSDSTSGVPFAQRPSDSVRWDASRYPTAQAFLPVATVAPAKQAEDRNVLGTTMGRSNRSQKR